MEEQHKNLVCETVRDLLGKMGFDATVELVEKIESGATEGEIVCNIRTDNDSHLLIGQYGVNLQALQHLARIIVRKKTDAKVNFTLDINSYRQDKNQSLIDLANLAAEQAILEKRAIIMKPMTAYERRIVHMELSKNAQVLTESIGEGENRKIVVKPSSAL